MSKKIFVVLVLLMLFLSLAGCKTGLPQEEMKVVKFDSVPQGADVFVDNQKIGETPIEYKLPIGTHNILIIKDGFEGYNETLNVTNDGKEESIIVVLKKEFIQCEEIIHFDDRPIFGHGFPDLSYCGIYLNDTVDISGFTKLDSFDLIFPSGKKVHFDTERTNYKDAYGEDIRKFYKNVTFDEIGEYKIFSDGRIVIFGSGGYKEFKFQVLYKAKPKDAVTLGSLNGNPKDENTILVPAGKEITVKLLLTDGKGNVARNKPIGWNNLKTDENGIVSIKIGVRE
jgi:hypothetical protein